jgi:tetratricopeptide (TPR) repeat protein
MNFLVSRIPYIQVFWLFFTFFICFSGDSIHSQELFPSSYPLANTDRYFEIRESIKSENYSLAEKLIQNELSYRLGDPELEYYQVDLWVKKANVLYEREQFKSALEYYYKVYHSWPNHPTVRERIDRWKDNEPYNKIIQTKKTSFDSKIEDHRVSLDSQNTVSDVNMEILLLNDRLDRNNGRIENFLSIIYVTLGFLIAICTLLLVILVKLISIPFGKGLMVRSK